MRLGEGTEQAVLADTLWATDTPGVNATVLDDYRAFVQQGGLPFNEAEDEVATATFGRVYRNRKSASTPPRVPDAPPRVPDAPPHMG